MPAVRHIESKGWPTWSDPRLENASGDCADPFTGVPGGMHELLDRACLTTPQAHATQSLPAKVQAGRVSERKQGKYHVPSYMSVDIFFEENAR